MLIIGITGPARSGKDTVAQILNYHAIDELGRLSCIVSLASPLKAMLLTILHEYDLNSEVFHGEQKEAVIEGLGHSPREMLQTLGTEWGRDLLGKDFWIKITQHRIKKAQESSGIEMAIIPDVRFDNEAAMCDYVIQVQRSERPEIADSSHRSELGVSPAYITHTINNCGGIPDLHPLIIDVLRDIGTVGMDE